MKKKNTKNYYLHDISGLTDDAHFIDTSCFKITKKKEGFILGRSGHFKVSDSSVSRSHAKFTMIGSSVYLVDLKSTNGTRVNGRLVNLSYGLSHNQKFAPKTMVKQGAKLKNKDIIQTGRRKWIFTTRSTFNPDWLRRPYISGRHYKSKKPNMFVNIAAAKFRYAGILNPPCPDQRVVDLLNHLASYTVYKLEPKLKTVESSKKTQILNE